MGLWFWRKSWRNRGKGIGGFVRVFLLLEKVIVEMFGATVVYVLSEEMVHFSIQVDHHLELVFIFPFSFVSMLGGLW